MKRVNIFTSGKMKGLTKAEALSWRIDFERKLLKRLDADDVDICCYHPPIYYNYVDVVQQSDREIKEWELNHLRDCDIMIVNLDGVNDSVGTHYELATADAANHSGGKHIYIIGIGETRDVHPWILDSMFRIESDIESAVRYIVDYLIY